MREFLLDVHSVASSSSLAWSRRYQSARSSLLSTYRKIHFFLINVGFLHKHNLCVSHINNDNKKQRTKY